MFKIVFSVFIVLSTIILKAQNNNVVEFYTIDYNRQMLCKIDTKGNMKDIATIHLQRGQTSKYIGMDYSKQSGKLYITNGKYLYEITPKNGNSTLISTFYTTDGVQPLLSTFISISDDEKTYIFNEQSAGDQGKLYRLHDFATGELTQLGSLLSGMASILGIEFDDNGTLWTIDECCEGAINYFNLQTGIIQGSIRLNKNIKFPTDLDFQENVMYFLDIKNEFKSNESSLCKVDLVTGEVEILHTYNTILTGLSEYHEKDTCDNTVFKYKSFLEKDKINFEGDAVEYDGIVRLTKQNNFQNGVVWYKDYLPLQGSFKTEFTFRVRWGWRARP